LRTDQAIVAEMVPRGSRVLDLGSGDGKLLAHLAAERGCSVSGIEASDEGFFACVARGVPVVQAEIDAGVSEFADASFDVVVLSQRLQATNRPAVVLAEMLRVGRSGIVSFRNVGYWPHRADLAIRGRMTVSAAEPHAWHDTPNIHLCTISDFERLVREIGLRVDRRVLLDAGGDAAVGRAARLRPNLLAAGAVYGLSR
jgi:methionine biosynthesis protein MetW